jgi:Ser/Thr protein kinase RdoA (MazF antagonist)
MPLMPVGEFNARSLAELEQQVREHLRCWALPPATAIRLLNVSENATFLLSAPGRELVLRVHRLGQASVNEIRSELAWIGALREDARIETAAPVRGTDGEAVQILGSRAGAGAGATPRFAVAFERLPGQEPALSEALRWFERLGELTARLHRHARTWTLPPGFVRQRWDVEAMVGAYGRWGPWRTAVGLDSNGRAVLDEAVTVIRRRLERFGTGAERFGLVHADLRMANLLIDGATMRLIDFDDCGFGWFAYDFAASVSFIEHETVLPELKAAWCSGYRQSAELSAEAEAEIPTFVMLRRILLTAWLTSHADAPFARDCGVSFTLDTVTLAEQFLRGRLLAS